MKKLSFKICMAVIISALISQKAVSQIIPVNAKATTSEAVFSAEGNAFAFKSTAHLNKAGLRAMKNLNESFKSASNAKWYVDGKTIYAIISSPDGNTYINYNKSGYWNSTLKTYQEDYLPKDVRAIVKRSAYYDFTIKVVQELTTEMGTFYVVNLEDETDYKQVVVFEGALTLLKEFKKG